MNPCLRREWGEQVQRAELSEGNHPFCTKRSAGRLGIRSIPFITDPCRRVGQSPKAFFLTVRVTISLYLQDFQLF